jgi:porphobilinogen synthase
LRDLVAETTFSVAQLIQPVFVVESLAESEPIEGLGDNLRHGIASAVDAIGRDVDAGVRHFLLFAVPDGREARPLRFDFVSSTVASIKERFGDALHLWVDICLCSSTSHGHCAVLGEHGEIDLSSTLDSLVAMALAAASAGADGVSPSDMMDGRTARLRDALDAGGYGAVPIMSYSSKFASQFYGPFRGAADSAPRFGDRRHYQIDVRSRRDALESSARCAREGADLLMVKPGLTSLDLIGPIAEDTRLPVGAYQVSGEYASLLSLAERGFVTFDAALLETWLVFRRAGAAFIITYGARRARQLGLA